jgi:hypothetical protein
MEGLRKDVYAKTGVWDLEKVRVPWCSPYLYQKVLCGFMPSFPWLTQYSRLGTNVASKVRVQEPVKELYCHEGNGPCKQQVYDFNDKENIFVKLHVFFQVLFFFPHRSRVLP